MRSLRDAVRDDAIMPCAAERADGRLVDDVGMTFMLQR